MNSDKKKEKPHYYKQNEVMIKSLMSITDDHFKSLTNNGFVPFGFTECQKAFKC